MFERNRSGRQRSTNYHYKLQITGVSSGFKTKKGVRQGCVLSPNLYNLYTEKIYREIEGMPGVVIGGVNINDLRYADDTGLLAIDSGKLQDLINTVNEKGK